MTHSASRRWQVKGGLRSSELLMIQRGLQGYIQGWREIKVKATTQHEKDEAQGRVDATVALSRRLTRELEEVK